MKKIKKFLLFFLCIINAISFAACVNGNEGGGNEDDGITSSNENKDDENEDDELKDIIASNILIAYFSRTGENYASGGNVILEIGNTAKMAGYIKDNLPEFDLFEIVPKVPYPYGYEDTKTRATQERNSNARPEIANQIDGFEDYDIIFIGYPIWWGTAPMIIHTFLDSYNFGGKTIIPFCTHGGSGFGSSINDIKQSASTSTFATGLAISGSQISNNSSKDSVTNWIKNLGL